MTKHAIHIWWKRDEDGSWFIHRITTRLRDWDGSTMSVNDMFTTVDIESPQE